MGTEYDPFAGLGEPDPWDDRPPGMDPRALLAGVAAAVLTVLLSAVTTAVALRLWGG